MSSQIEAPIGYLASSVVAVFLRPGLMVGNGVIDLGALITMGIMRS